MKNHNNDKQMFKSSEEKEISSSDKKLKDDEGFIYLHALMTIIKNDEILSNVFEISEEKISMSKQSNSLEVIHANSNGAILLKNGDLKIVGNLPEHWKSINKKSHQSINIPTLK